MDQSFNKKIECLLDYLHINWAAKYLECLPGKENSMPVVVIQYTGIVTQYLNKNWKKSVSSKEGSKKATFRGVTLGA